MALMSLSLAGVGYWTGAHGGTRLAIASIGMLVVSLTAVNATLLPYSADIYPTAVRVTGTGLAAGATKLGGRARAVPDAAADPVRRRALSGSGSGSGLRRRGFRGVAAALRSAIRSATPIGRARFGPRCNGQACPLRLAPARRPARTMPTGLPERRAGRRRRRRPPAPPSRGIRTAARYWSPPAEPVAARRRIPFGTRPDTPRRTPAAPVRS